MLKERTLGLGRIDRQIFRARKPWCWVGVGEGGSAGTGAGVGVGMAPVLVKVRVLVSSGRWPEG